MIATSLQVFKLIVLFLFRCDPVNGTKNSNNSCSDAGGQCVSNGASEKGCLDALEFKQRVSSFQNNETFVSNFLRGVLDNVVTTDDINNLVKSMPMSDFIDASGYDESEDEIKSGDGRAYSAPVGYAGLGLKELSRSAHLHNKMRYEKLLEVREKVRSATEKALNLCPGTLLIDFTTISQKTEGGAHRSHADNCLHYFRKTASDSSLTSDYSNPIHEAACDPSRSHPYPNRVAASILYLNDPLSGNYGGGQFYFANRTNGEVQNDGSVPIQSGRMIYFTSGVENLHGALPVEVGNNSDDQPRRLALAMWYVVDPTLEEYVPEFKQQSAHPSPGNSNSLLKKRVRKVDPDDPSAPKVLFSIPMPANIDVDSFFQSMGRYLVSKQNQPSAGSWKVNQYGEFTLHVLFKDHSAMFSLDFGVVVDNGDKNSDKSQEPVVLVERHTDGKKSASLQYMLQESVLLHGVLDEFLRLLFSEQNSDGYIEQSVDIARKSLPARRA